MSENFAADWNAAEAERLRALLHAELAEVERLRKVLTDAQRSLEAAAADHDCEWCSDCAYNIEVVLRAKETG